MLRSTQSFLKQAAKLSSRTSHSSASLRAPAPANASCLATRASSSTAGSSGSSTSSDYDRIMRTTVSNFSTSSANNTGGEASYTPTHGPFCAYAPPLPSPMMSADASPSQRDATTLAASAASYRSVEYGPAGQEDYDGYELHHPPCERTQELSYYDDCFDISSGGEMGSLA